MMRNRATLLSLFIVMSFHLLMITTSAARFRLSPSEMHSFRFPPVVARNNEPEDHQNPVPAAQIESHESIRRAMIAATPTISPSMDTVDDVAHVDYVCAVSC